MGGHSRYKVSMFDHQWRVLLVDEAGVTKDEMVSGHDDFATASAAYKAAIKANPGRHVQLRQRTRIVKRSDRAD